MLDDAADAFLSSVTEREFDAPFVALLRAHGYSRIHLLHGTYEFGKDVIAQHGDPLVQFAFQTKAGDIGLSEWMGKVRGQVDVLRNNDLAHPDYDVSLPRVGVLVLTGRLAGGAALEAQDYKEKADSSGSAGFEVWDKERLVELLVASPSAGLTGFSDGPMLELLGRIDQGKVNEPRLERFSERWIGGSDGIGWRAVLECAFIANRLRSTQRRDLACFAALCLLRAVWASAHGTEPPPAIALEQADLTKTLFVSYAQELWNERSSELLDPRELIRDDIGIAVTYPLQCSRLLEVLGMYGLTEYAEDSDAIAEWISAFFGGQPGATHPVSDRWAVSLLPALTLLARTDRARCSKPIENTVRWLGDRNDAGGLGLAGPHAEPLEEIEYLLGSSLEHIDKPPRRHSYLAGMLLDFAALLEDGDLYDLVYNEIAALDIRPFVAIPRDDVSQYMATGHGIDVPINTSPKYLEYFADGSDWRMADHHDDEVDRYYLGRNGRLWDHLALSIVTRDRHWVAGLRALVRSGPVD